MPRDDTRVTDGPQRRPTGVPRTPSDDETLAALLRGEEAAFASLVRRHHATMVRVALRHVRERATAEEVVQEAWLGFLEGLERFAGRASLGTYLCAIVVNQARTRAVREARSVPFSALAAPSAGDVREPGPDELLAPGRWSSSPEATRPGAPERALATAETLGAVRTAIDGLPERQRRVILLRDVHGMTSAEAQEALGVSEGNQRVLLHRARRGVREAVQRRLGEVEAL